MDPTYFAITLALIGITVGVFCWQEPKIKPLEELRTKHLQAKAKSLENKSAIQIYSYLASSFDGDRYILMPIRALTPYKKIKIVLIISFVLSILFGLLSKSLSHKSYHIIDDWIVLSPGDIFMFVLMPFWSYVSLKLWEEYKYMIDISRKLG